jgi:hypothetical protein
MERTRKLVWKWIHVTFTQMAASGGVFQETLKVTLR